MVTFTFSVASSGSVSDAEMGSKNGLGRLKLVSWLSPDFMPDVSSSSAPAAFPAAFATIDDVIVQLDFIIDTARRRGSADGYFAALYRRVTETVK